MYRINKKENSIVKLKERLFSELGFKERENLQEWVADNPQVLGEELLIIQKEFDGFSETNERLDLLALDKDGGIVVIENKLDDTGKDVVWQALKYTSYCSTLTTEQIVTIFQKYLGKEGRDEDAKEVILDFLQREDADELLLNDKDQRIMFVANHYRKEVTSTVMWLLEHDIQIQCFRAVPYSLGEDLFLQIEQIIPLPETADFLISAKEKEREKKYVGEKAKETNAFLNKFWSQLKNELRSRGIKEFEQVRNLDRWYFGFSSQGAKYSFALGRQLHRVEMYFYNDEDKQKIDAMYQFKDEIEQQVPNLIWQRLEDKKASRIKLEMTQEIKSKFRGKWGEDEYTEDLINWLCDSMAIFYPVLTSYWERVRAS